jgi:chemotaxis protein histidine kinase CheA/ActR/RegA family two-component response regulator
MSDHTNAHDPIAPFLAEMRKELTLALPDFTRWLQTLGASNAEAPEYMEAVEAYGGQLERTGMTAEMLGMAALNQWCVHLNATLLAVPTVVGNARVNAMEFYKQWPPLMDAYLASPADFDASIALAQYLASPDSPAPIDEMASLTLVEGLTTPPVLPEDLVADLAASEALVEVTEADTSLVLPEDADRDVFNAFIDEAPSKLEEFSKLTALIASGSANVEHLRTAKRIAHSFKGSANIVGIRGVASLGHYTEDVLEFFEQNPIKPPRALGRALVEASDCMSQMVSHLQGEDAAPGNSFAVLSNIVAWANKVKTGEIAEMGEHDNVADDVLGVTSFTLSNSSAAPIQPSAASANATTAAAPKSGSTDPDASLRVPVKTIDELFRLVGELNTKIGQLENRVKITKDRSRSLLTQNLLVQQRVLELEKLVVLSGLSLQKPAGATDVSFDPLELDRYTELYTATRSLVEVTADAREIAIAIEEDVTAVSHDLAHQNQVNKDLRYQVISTRMTPVNTLSARLTRNVRQTCQQTGKEAELVITGGDILIDGDVLNKLADPLLHILRNAIDHGVELPDERVARGKSPHGRITLDFVRQGSSVVVRVKDDGKGLDYVRIHDKALDRGLVASDTPMSHAELARVTLLPGFSTRDQVSEISGRGVGMDVVASRLAELKGSVELHSDPGDGCEVVLRFQASLITQHTLLIEATKQLFAVPIHNIEQALPPGWGEATKIDDEHWRLTLGEASYPVRDLAVLMGYPSTALTAQNIAARPKVLVRTEVGSIAVMVDRVIDSRDLIIKTLGRYLPKVHGVSGTTLLGEGSVVPLLNVPELLAEPLAYSAAAAQLAEAARQQSRRVLVVDDSLSVRKALIQLLQDSAFDVVGASDGLEAIRALDKFTPDVICTDLEMPNMNGLELTEHLRLRADTRALPIIMITSRSLDKHREQAKRVGVDYYVTKPYTDAELLKQVHLAIQQGTDVVDIKVPEIVSA